MWKHCHLNNIIIARFIWIIIDWIIIIKFIIIGFSDHIKLLNYVRLSHLILSLWIGPLVAQYALFVEKLLKLVLAH